jgi:hypothetical protein
MGLMHMKEYLNPSVLMKVVYLFVAFCKTSMPPIYIRTPIVLFAHRGRGFAICKDMQPSLNKLVLM